jgi:elongation factor Ts
VAEITAQAVKVLRETTGAGRMYCKKALAEADGNLERAVEVLRERGLAKAGKRAGRETSEGAIALALAGAAGGLVELGCETDFVAKTPDFQSLAESLAQVVAEDSSIDGPPALLDADLEGRKVSEQIAETVGKVGENIVPKRVSRLEVDGAGRVGGYVHAGGKLGVLVALRTEAAGDAVDALAKDVAMHVAAADPSPVAVDRDGVSPELIQKERDILKRQAEQEGKPEKVVEKIVEGRIRKYFAEVCLLEQAFVKDPDQSVAALLEKAAEQLGAPVSVAGFVRFRLGEATES